MKTAVRMTLNVLVTLFVALGLARLAGSVPFAPWATDVLVRFAALFGAYGDEKVEDVYMLTTLLLSLFLAALLVWAVNRALARRRT
ncbi:Non-ribosomal peptide synthetase (plasmid) [Paraburkholderia kururiensis]|uniref:non-ribosomal peptide synthetase n=1 Tax=Paraburkholderia kururiensis TaxID=984307 RepID=UPI0039A6E66B